MYLRHGPFATMEVASVSVAIDSKAPPQLFIEIVHKAFSFVNGPERVISSLPRCSLSNR